MSVGKSERLKAWLDISVNRRIFASMLVVVFMTGIAKLFVAVKEIIVAGYFGTSEVVDAVILWWREGDGDLVDELMDALTYLTETGPIWVLTPKLGRDGHVESSDIQDAAPIAGLSQTSTIALAQDWAGTRLVARKVGKR